MKQRRWIITGATSLISEAFARRAAKQGEQLLLIARDQEQLAIIASDIQLRYQIHCETMVMDFSQTVKPLLDLIHQTDQELDLFIGHSLIMDNAALQEQDIERMLTCNINHTVKLIDSYIKKTQQKHRILFLSSVAACRGRAKNSLYAASKAAIEVYLEGLQQKADKEMIISTLRLGYIDTNQTFGKPGIFYAASPDDCAQACWLALNKRKNKGYFPRFWWPLMTLIKALPLLLFRRVD